MPLSEEELRLLEQMERALVAEDPKLASTLRGTTMRRNARRRVLVGAVVFLAGITLLMTGAIMRMTVVGIVGFVVMLVSAYFVLASWRGQNHVAAGAVALTGQPDGTGLSLVQGGKSSRRSSNRSRGRTGRQHHSMMERFEERWRRRREQNGGF